MTKEFLWAIFKRFLRAFAAGGLGSVVMVLAANSFEVATFQDFTRWIYIIAVAFITGGLMALEKMVRFDKAKLKSIAVIFILITLGLTCSCSRRVAVVQPEGVQVVVDDRVTDLWKAEDRIALTAFADAIQKLPPDQQKDAIVEFLKVYSASIAARERVATIAIQREKEAGLNWLQALKEAIAFAGLAYSAAK